MQVQFGCGEFVPGGEPIRVNPIKTPVPDVIVPDIRPPRSLSIFVPPVGEEPRWKCVFYDAGTAGYVPPPQGFRYVNGGYRRCEKCDGQLNPATGGFNPSPGDNGCDHQSIQECQRVCLNPIERLPTFTPADPGGGGGAAGGGTGGPTTGPRGVVGPTTPRGGSPGYMCQQTVIICPEDAGKPERLQRVLSVSHRCVACDSYNENNRTNLKLSEGPRRAGQDTVMIYRSDCAYKSASECSSKCPPSPFTGSFVRTCDEVSVSIPETGTRGRTLGSFDPPIDPEINSVRGRDLGAFDTPQGSQTSNPYNQTTIVNVGLEASVQIPPNPGSEPNRSEIYHSTYNFFQARTSEQSETYGVNSRYPSIFKTQVHPSISQLIDLENTSLPWRESMIFSLTNGQIEGSLNPELLTAFNNIHYPGGQLVGKDTFLEVIRKHLLTGTLSEFDVSFYTSLADRQSNDIKIVYTNTSDLEKSQRAGLGVIASEAVVADPDAHSGINKRSIRRQRRLNTDVRANCEVVTLSGTSKTLFLNDPGIEVITLDLSEDDVPTGDGDGYYMDIQQVDGNHTPLVTSADYPITVYIPPSARFNALTLFKEDRNYILTADSLDGKNEFIANDEGASALKPLYLTLDLNTTTYQSANNPLVSKYSASYSVEEDQDYIDEHSINNGYAITKVHIDYRDPIYRYILDSGKATLSLNDINFRNFEDSRGITGGVRFSRNIPFGLIILPVRGSKFNPFNGFSTINTFGNSSQRQLSLTPNIDISDKDLNEPDMLVQYIYTETGDLKVGLVEPNDNQNVRYMFDPSAEKFLNTFYTNGSYTTSASPVSSHGISYMIREVIDYIKTTYDPETITWYDVVSRLPINKVGELLYDSNQEIISQLERGYRDDIRIQHVLKSDIYASDKLLPEDDLVIIKEGDR